MWAGNPLIIFLENIIRQKVLIVRSVFILRIQFLNSSDKFLVIVELRETASFITRLLVSLCRYMIRSSTNLDCCQTIM